MPARGPNRFSPMKPPPPGPVFHRLSRRQAGRKLGALHSSTNSPRRASDVIASTGGWVSLRSAALAWVQARNAETFLGHSDWRLPNAKELQSLVDYTRAPAVTQSATIDPIFECTSIQNEGDALDWPAFWSSTTHLDGPPDQKGRAAVCFLFGLALGFMSMPPGSPSACSMCMEPAPSAPISNPAIRLDPQRDSGLRVMSCASTISSDWFAVGRCRES